MNKILSDYKKLTAVRKVLEKMNEEIDKNPEKRFSNWNETSEAANHINDLKENILLGIKENIEIFPKEIVSQLKSLDMNSKKLLQLSRKVTSGKEYAIEYMVGLTEQQDAKNNLIEAAVTLLKELKPTTVKKNKP